MNVPSDIDPLGTPRKLSVGDYIQDGLVLQIDCLAQGDGTAAALTDFVSGNEFSLSAPCEIDAGVLVSPSTSFLEGEFQRDTNYCVEIVSVPMVGSNYITGVCALYVIPTPVRYYPTMGVYGDVIKVTKSPSSTYLTNDFLMPASNLSHVTTFCFPSAYGNPYVDAVEITEIVAESGASSSRLLNLSNATRFCAMRVYNRRLSAAEISHNASIDSQRWDKNKTHS